MKCLSVRQPWAWLLFHGKDIENRSWHPPRAPLRIAIHASKTISPLEYEGAFWVAPQAGWDMEVMSPNDPRIVYGAIIGEVTVTGWGRSSQSKWAERGAVQWWLESAVEYHTPIPYRGRRGLYEIPDSIVRGE